jgi:hypothetical protein
MFSFERRTRRNFRSVMILWIFLEEKKRQFAKYLDSSMLLPRGELKTCHVSKIGHETQNLVALSSEATF